MWWTDEGNFSFSPPCLHVAAVPYCCSLFPCSPENGFNLTKHGILNVSSWSVWDLFVILGSVVTWDCGCSMRCRDLFDFQCNMVMLTVIWEFLLHLCWFWIKVEDPHCCLLTTTGQRDVHLPFFCPDLFHILGFINPKNGMDKIKYLAGTG